MDKDDQKQIGILIEQGRWLAREMTEVKLDVKEIKESHLAFKWKIVGASSVIGFIASLLVDFMRH